MAQRAGEILPGPGIRRAVSITKDMPDPLRSQKSPGNSGLTRRLKVHD